MCAKYIETTKIDQFVEITETTKSVALEYLQIYDGNVQLAIDDFYVEKKLRSILGKSQTQPKCPCKTLSKLISICKACCKKALHHCSACCNKHDETRKICFLTIIP